LPILTIFTLLQSEMISAQPALKVSSVGIWVVAVIWLEHCTSRCHCHYFNHLLLHQKPIMVWNSGNDFLSQGVLIYWPLKWVHVKNNTHNNTFSISGYFPW